MRVEMIEKESVRDFVSMMTEKFLDEGNEVTKFSSCYTGHDVWDVCEDWRTSSFRLVPNTWTEDVSNEDGHRKHPFQVLSEKERELDEKIRILKFDQMNEVIDLFKHENPDWKENHMEVIWDLEMERDSHLI